ncbi:MAG: Abi family protein [Dialister sp.]|nr:Abi family protein [Dialister sp.]
MPNLPDKPFKTFPELVSHLQDNHNLFIIDPIWAENALRFIPYYDLINGYKDIFMVNDKFQPPVNFEYLYLFHAFDRQIQNILFAFSNLIEDYFKNNLAYVLSRNFGVFEDDYLSKTNYVSSKGRITYAQVYKQIIAVYTDKLGNKKPITKIDEPTAHYVYTHNHIPPWILLKNTSFSNAINLFILLKPKQKEELVDMLIPSHLTIDQKIQLLQYTLTLVRKCRNTIAHNLKFISFDCKKYSGSLNHKSIKKFIPNDLLSWKDIRKDVGIHDIYAYICFSMALIPNSIEKRILIENLCVFLDGYTNDKNYVHQNVIDNYFQFTHIPTDIIQRLYLYREKVQKNMPMPRPPSI